MRKLWKKLMITTAALALVLAVGLPALAAGAPVLEGDAPAPAEQTATSTDLAAGATPTDLAPREQAPASAQVASWEELKTALAEDNGITAVTFTQDITATSANIAIHPAKAAVRINGDGHSLTQYQANGTGAGTGMILVSDARALTTQVTLQNLTVNGKNSYGLVWVNDSLSTVSLVYENLSYTGPQAVHHRNGLVRLVGGSYTTTSGELAEARHVELGGSLTITGPATGVDAVLWLVSTSSTLRVLAGADVTVNAKNYFIYGSIASASLEQGASLSLTAGRFGFSYAADSVASFQMAEDSALYIALNTTESYAALRVSKSFEMAPGSAATILRSGTAGIGLRLTAAGARAVFNQPRRVFLYSSAGVPLRFTGAGSLAISTTAVNVWAKTGWPLAPGLDSPPTHVWNRAGNAELTLTGSYTEAVNNSLGHNLTLDDPVSTELTGKTFNLEGSQLVAFGAGALAIDTPTSESPALTGAAAPAAEMQAAYILADGRGGNIGGTSEASGRYSLPVTGGALQVGSQVTVLSRHNDLILRQVATVLDDTEHRLAFVAVPGTVGFGARSVPEARSLWAPEQAGLGLAVQDSRLAPAPWRIDASLAHPLQADIGGTRHSLSARLLYKTEAGESLALNELPQTVYRQSTGQPGAYQSRWDDDNGLFLELLPGEIYSGARYSTTIQWTLVDAP